MYSVCLDWFDLCGWLVRVWLFPACGGGNEKQLVIKTANSHPFTSRVSSVAHKKGIPYLCFDYFLYIKKTYEVLIYKCIDIIQPRIRKVKQTSYWTSKIENSRYSTSKAAYKGIPVWRTVCQVYVKKCKLPTILKGSRYCLL